MIRNRIVRLAAAVPVAFVVALGGGALVAPDRAAAAPPPARLTPVPATADKPGELKDALLAAGDLPKGYAALDASLGAGPLAGLFDADTIGGDPCRSAEAAADKKKVRVEVAGFIKGTDGPVLLESLAGTGRKLARDLVSDTAEMLERCPNVRSGTLTMAMSPMPKFPRFGDESVAVSMIVTVRNGAVSVEVSGKMVVAAVDDVYVAVVLVGDPEPEDRELKKITKAAVKKLEKVA